MLTTDLLTNNLNDVVTYKEYFAALGYQPKDKIYFRRFKDQGESDGGGNYDQELRFIDNILPTLHRVNDDNNGIFYVVNGGGQRKELVKEAKALFTDFDDFPFNEQIRRLNDFKYEPSIIVKTQKSLHCYWILTGDKDINKWDALQLRMIQHFESDPTIKDRNRVMRLYGFDHHKADPVRVTLIKFTPELVYTMQQFDEILPALQKTAKKATTGTAKRDPGEIIPHGRRHQYVVSRIGYYVAKLPDATENIIFQAVYQDFLENCEQIPQDDPAEFERRYLPAIRKYQSNADEARKDPQFYSKAMSAWKDEHPGEEWETSGATWADAEAAYYKHKELEDRITAGLKEWRKNRVQASESILNDEAGEISTTEEKTQENADFLFKQWAAGEPIPDTPDGTSPTAFFTAHGYLTPEGIPTERGQAIIDAPAEDPAPAENSLSTGKRTFNAAEYLQKYYTGDLTYFSQYKGRKTGIHEDIDKHLTLYPGLAVLGGASSLGKTTFAVNLIDKLLERGETVLFFSLEQLPIEIITKHLAKRVYSIDPFSKLTNLDIKNGAGGPDLEQAKTDFMDTAAKYRLITGDFRTTAANIAEYVERYRQAHDDIKPIVIIDYLQLIAPPKDFKGGIREAIDENLKTLKDMQKNNGLFVLVISSFNRSSNYEPVSYESFKETGMIEFTCDYVLGLQLSVLDADNTAFYSKTGPKGGSMARPDNEKKAIIATEQKKLPKPVEFVCLKNRNGKQYFTAYFDYYPQYDVYIPQQEFKSFSTDLFETPAEEIEII